MSYLIVALLGGAAGAIAGHRLAVAQRGWQDHRYHVRQVPVTWRAWLAQAGRFLKWATLLVLVVAVLIAGLVAQ